MLPSELGSQSPNHPALRGDRFTKTQSFFFNFYLSQCDLFIPPLHGFNSPSYSSYCILLSCNTPAFQFDAQLKSQPTVLSNHPIPPNCTYTQPATFVDQQSATTSQISRQKNTKRRQEKAIDRRGLIGGKQRAPQLHIHQIMSSTQQPPLATATTSGMAGQPTSSSSPVANGGNSGDDKKTPVAGTAQSKGNYKGFVAGVFSGVAKLSGMFCL